MTGSKAAGVMAGVREPAGLRVHQAEALAELERVFAGGRRRAWVVLPPGTGKTLAGLEAARRLGRPVVVLGPNTAIQGQWVREWGRRFAGAPAAGTGRGLEDAVNVLTYQALANFDPDAEVDEEGGASAAPASHIERLRPQGREVVEAMRGLGDFTLLLDECHHLLDTWGELVAELLRELPAATVIGLTATPPERLTRGEAALVDELFGPAVTGPSIPAAVREGFLAPFAELAWLTAPTAEEGEWLAAEAERFTELTTDLLDPGFASVPFLEWLDERVVARRRAGSDRPAVSWPRFEREHPDLAAAALRFHHAGLLALPDGARVREEHRHAPGAADWVCLLDDYVTRCLRRGGTARDAAAVEAIRTALPAVGYALTARGVRGGRSPVDRVLARSAAKTRAVREILGAEQAALGDRLRAVVLCDYERATATLPARLTGVLDEQAGAARLVLAELLADERTAALEPVLVTGRTVAASARTAKALAEFCAEREPGVRLDPIDPAGDGPVELTGSGGWQSRRWVPLVTRFFEEGGARVLIGTRAMLGEGWDARGVNTLVDLTEATTATAVVQTRGRALRTDPAWPEKTAHTWSVVCVAAGHPKGAADWERFVRKHDDYFGITDAGEVMAGVAHVHPELSPYAPPGEGEFDRFNAVMLRRAGERERVRELWRVGEPYDDRLVHTVRVAGGGVRTPAGPERAGAVPGVPPAAVPAARGITPVRRPRWWPPVAGGVAVDLAVALSVPEYGAAAGVAAGAAAWWGARAGGRAVAGRRQLRAAAPVPGEADLTALAYALADGLRGAGLTPRGAEAVVVAPGETGTYRIELAGVPPAASACFASAYDELISPVTASARYLLPRWVVGERGYVAGWRLLAGRSRANEAVYHAVPAVLGENRRRVDALVAGWRTWVGVGEPVYARSPEGVGLLAAWTGVSPVEGSTTVLRAAWA
ncbi:DEAD/DEAH box helicase family protein [Streptomyces boninensis]|uniref:DEAD/DEAH box helicase family protein n=1 Tax=Streptomyces boninensis TaxID=2039455 RepID=UPI003B21BE5B